MPALPLLKIHDRLRINLFNVTTVVKLSDGEVVIHFVGDATEALHGEDAATFLRYFDHYCEDMQSALESSGSAAAPRPEGAVTDRDYGDLLATEAPPAPLPDQAHG